ncbi:MAG: hypothetical protein J5497_04090 [Selenomonadaceae bacterium]|nr:hypothetical protein [Selenomonadaceae bacterium]
MTAKEIEDKLFQRYTNGDDFCREVLELLKQKDDELQGANRLRSKFADFADSLRADLREAEITLETDFEYIIALKKERNEAREIAADYRHKFASAMGASYNDKRFSLPWEGKS